MTSRTRAQFVLAVCAYVAAFACVHGAGGGAAVEVACDRTTLYGSPFPTDRYTTEGADYLTGKRVNLPFPDCAVRKSDCQDISILNTLDGFSTDPRIVLPFTGPIDVRTATSETIFLINLGDITTGSGMGQHVGINQRVWDPNTTTLIFRPDDFLAEHTSYALIVTSRLLDTAGHPVHRRRECAAAIAKCNAKRLTYSDDAMCLTLRSANFTAVSMFTTMSSSADMFKILGMIRKTGPKPIDFLIGNTGAGRARAVFSVDSISNVSFLQQVSNSSVLQPQPVPIAILKAAKGVGKIAYGEFSSPNFLTGEQYIPATPTGGGLPRVRGNRKLVVQIFVPAGKRPLGGWPVVIFGHPLTDSVYGVPWLLAPSLASAGLATFAINAVGHGGGPGGQIVVSNLDKTTVSFSAGGRGVDLNGDGLINSTEGIQAIPPYDITGFRDGVRQTAIDMLQLVQQVRGGIDIDGDDQPDFDVNRIYYGGQSLGGVVGTIVMGMDPTMRAGVLNVAGGSLVNAARLGDLRRTLAASFAARVPPLTNDAAGSFGFNENIPLRNLPVVINDIPGALAVAEVLDRAEWSQQSGNPLTYAAFIRRSPPFGGVAKRVLVQFAKGDQTVVNPTTTALIRAGSLQDRATFFRADLLPNATRAGYNPHGFLIDLFDPSHAPYALQAQQQFATFLATDGLVTIDPGDRGSLFEVPIALPLPEGLNFR
jgi:hypothetical protein